MLMKTALYLLLVTVLQVSAEYVEPDFIENVAEKEWQLSLPRIVSGWEAKPGQFPHHASLRMVSAVGGVSSCGGSFISREWVMTAAHCTAGRITIVVRGGVVSLTNPEYISETTEIYNHPLFDVDRPLVVQTNDISVVKLWRPIVFTTLLRTIRVQPRVDVHRNYDGQRLIASGHGRTWTNGPLPEVLNWVYLRGVSNVDCSRVFGTALIVESSICARFYNVTSQSTCQGDSGGPLVHVDSDGVSTLVGIASFVAGGNFGCHSGLPGGFIRPAPYLSWLKDVSGIDFENLDEEEPTTVTPELTTTTTPEEEPTTVTPEEPTTVTPEEEEEPTTPTPEEEEDSEEGGGEEEEEDSSSESDEDDEVSDLLKRLEVKVKVKVRFNKYKIKKNVEKEKEIRKHH